MKIFSLWRYLLLISIGVVLLVGCSDKSEVTLEKNEDLADKHANWTTTLEKGVYFKKTGENAGILYVNLDHGETTYSTIDVEVNDTYRIDITEKDALQDSEVANKYIGELKSDIPIEEFEVYLNGKRVMVDVVE